jgi:hypothetical protein
MRGYLTEANRDLLYQIEVIQDLIGSARVAGELTPYVGQVAQLCAGLRQQALRNLKDLEYGVAGTLDDILSWTQEVTKLFELVNTRLATPIIRARPEDVGAALPPLATRLNARNSEPTVRADGWQLRDVPDLQSAADLSR